VIPHGSDISRACSIAALVCVLAVLACGCCSTVGPSEPTWEPPITVLVPAGSFVMGDGYSYGGSSERGVTLTRDFELGQYEVTNAEFIAAAQWAYDHGHVLVYNNAIRDNLDGSSVVLLAMYDADCEIQFVDGVFTLRDAGHGEDNENHPAKEMSWYGAARYCDWLSMQADPPLARAYAHDGDWACNDGDPYSAEGYRLPTDAEWEYAAQYGDERPFPWGNKLPDCNHANYAFCEDWTLPVGSCRVGDSALGLCDMAGNVYEWCNDWRLHDLGTEPVIDPSGPESGLGRVNRGSAWGHDESHLPCASRVGRYAEGNWSYVGLRVARTVGDRSRS